MKPGFMVFTSLQWLRIFNAAVKAADGCQPSANLIRSHIH
jgi:hypothetical protein